MQSHSIQSLKRPTRFCTRLLDLVRKNLQTVEKNYPTLCDVIFAPVICLRALFFLIVLLYRMKTQANYAVLHSHSGN